MREKIIRCDKCDSTMLLDILECTICGYQGTRHQILDEHVHTCVQVEFHPYGRNHIITSEKKCIECGTKGEY